MTGIVFLSLLLLMLFAPTIWLSMTAKPIGPVNSRKPYRWGTLVALLSAISSLPFLAPALIAAETERVVIATAYLFSMLVLVATCLLLLERRRLGVLLFFATNIIFLVLTVAGPSIARRAAIFNDRRPAAGIFGYILINAVYFKKRWKLFKLSTPPENRLSQPIR